MKNENRNKDNSTAEPAYKRLQGNKDFYKILQDTRGVE